MQINWPSQAAFLAASAAAYSATSARIGWNEMRRCRPEPPWRISLHLFQLFGVPLDWPGEDKSMYCMTVLAFTCAFCTSFLALRAAVSLCASRDCEALRTTESQHLCRLPASHSHSKLSLAPRLQDSGQSLRSTSSFNLIVAHTSNNSQPVP